jgi:two-component sensor histidine kinase/putative methionine-R-sulfoxide reductase with GAF domain
VSPRVSSYRLVRVFLLALAYLLACMALDQVSLLFEVPPRAGPWFVLSPSLGLALLLASSLWYAPLVFVAKVLNGLWLLPRPLPPALILLTALLDTGVYTAAAAILRRGLGFDPRLRRLRDTLGLVAALLVTPFVAATLDEALLAWAGFLQWPQYIFTVLSRWVESAIGLTVLTPFLLLHVAPWGRAVVERVLRWALFPPRVAETRQRLNRRRLAKGLFEVAGSAAVIWGAFGSPLSYHVQLSPLTFLPIIAVALARGLSGGVVAVFGISFGVALAARLFGLHTGTVADLQASILTQALAGLLLGAVVTDWRRTEDMLLESGRRLALLDRAGQTFRSTLDLDQVLFTVLDEVRHLLGVVACSIWLVDPKTGDLICQQATGPQGDVVRNWRLKSGEGLAGWATRTGRSLIVGDAQADPRHYRQVDQSTGLPLRSILTVPLRTKRGVIGVLQAVDTVADRFTVQDLALLEPLATSAAASIENARLYEQAQRDAEAKSILLSEVNHRVKNILSAIVGLLYAEQRRLGAEGRKAEQALLRGLVNRVRSLAAVHDLLSMTEWAPVLLSELVTQVIHSTLEAVAPERQVVVEVTPSPVRVTAEQAHNLALVVNELMSNTVRHVLGERETAQVSVNISEEDGMVALQFRDDGPGYPESVLQQEQQDTGLDLVRNLVCRNLRGRLWLRNDSGAVAEIRFRALGQERGETGGE